MLNKLQICVAGTLLAMTVSSHAFAANNLDQQPQGPNNQLKQLSLSQLGDVEVTTVAKLPEELWQTPAAVSVLTQDDIRRSGAITIPELLRLVPGVDVAREQSDQWAVGIRGFNSQFSKGLLVLIDGRSVYTPLFEGVYWDVQDLALDDIDRIEVIRGPGGTIWGANAVNGVINIITKKARDTQGGSVSFSGIGPINRFVGQVRWGASPRSNLQFRIFAKGFNRGAELNPGHDPYDRWHQERGGFRADWQPSVKDELTASFMMYRGATGDQNQVGEYTPPAQITVDGQQLVSGGDLILRWDHRMRGGSSFYLQSYFDRTNRATTQFTETRDTFDLDFIYNITGLARNNIVLGAGLRESPSAIVQTQATVNFTPHQINNYVYSLFGQDTFQIVPGRLEFLAGTKLETNNYTGWGWQPTGRLLWTPKSHMTLWGAVSRALRTPGRVDRDLSLIGYAPGYNPPLFVQIAGDPGFRPEVLIGWEAGYRQLLRRNLYLDVAGFHNQHDNIESFGTIGVSFPTTPYLQELVTEPYANGLRGTSNGIEIAPDWELTNWLQLRGSYSYMHIALHSKAGFSQAAYASSYEGSSPAHQVNAQAVITPRRGFEIVPDYRFVSSLPAQNIPSYQTADLNATYQLKEHVQLSATGRNLLQPRHPEFPGDDSNTVDIRRAIFGGIGWTW